jgi:hypothetical protein
MTDRSAHRHRAGGAEDILLCLVVANHRSAGTGPAVAFIVWVAKRLRKRIVPPTGTGPVERRIFFSVW